MRKYLTPAETSQLSSMMLELAREIAEQYTVIDGVPASSYELAHDA